MKGKNLFFFITFALFNFAGAQPVTLDWAKSIEGTSYDHSNSIVIDNAGNTIITGWYTFTADFDPGSSVFNMTSAGSSDIFIQKLDANGNFLWAKSIGGTALDYGNSVTTDSVGNIYVTGFFREVIDFDPGPGVFNLSAFGITCNIFVLKLDANGDFVWAKSMGSNMNDEGASIALDENGNVYTTGFFRGTVDFDPGAGTFNLTSSNNDAVYVQKLDSNGNFIWAIMLDGLADVETRDRSINISSSRNIHLTGNFNGTVDFDPSTAVFNLTANNTDSFILKLDENGNFIWAKSMDGYPYTIATDDFENVYTTGVYTGSADMDPSTSTVLLPFTTTTGTFIQKLNSNGNFIWAKSLNGQTVKGYSEKIDPDNNLYITGYYVGGVDFDPNAGTFSLTSAGADDIFVLKLDNNGNFVWAISMGGTGTDLGHSVTINTLGEVYLTGNFSGISDFDPNAGTSNLTATSNRDIFVQKLSQTGVGIHENNVLNRGYIYPNPSSQFVTVNGSGLNLNEIYIFSINGQVLRRAIPQKGVLDISDLAPGIYFIKLIGEQKTITQKLIKQ